jgi:hypothetical protein
MAKEKNFTRGPRIRSGGQTGVDRAALDAAVLTGRPYEGWCPKGGKAEDFLHPPGLLTKYRHLMETPSESPEQRTDWNVRDSAATVVFVPDSKYCSSGSVVSSRPTTETENTRSCQGRVWLHTEDSNSELQLRIRRLAG